MKKLLLAMLALSSAATIAAPQPASGIFVDATQALHFVGGPFYAPNPASDAVYLADPPDRPRSILVCKPQTMNCDRFALTVNLTSTFRHSATLQKQYLHFSLVVDEQQPLPLVKPEFHFYLFDANGTELGRSEFGASNSLDYHFEVPLYVVPNGRYTVVTTGYNGMGARYSVAVRLGPAE